MDTEVKSNLYPCAHCNQTGTCTSGAEKQSCMACIRTNDLKGKGHVGLMCGSCNGLGLAEPRTERINKRIKPILAIVLVFILLTGLYASAIVKSPNFPEILAFSATLLGSITGYYFSLRGSKNT